MSQERLLKDNVLFVPNRSFTSYCGIDAVENDFDVPLVGSRNLLRCEDRGGPQDYYWLLEKAGMPAPRKVKDPRGHRHASPSSSCTMPRRSWNGASSPPPPPRSTRRRRKSSSGQGVIEAEYLGARPHGGVHHRAGVQPGLLLFAAGGGGARIELLGIDWRFETSLDGFVRLPAAQQLALNDRQRLPEYTVCGHNSATMRESLLENAFELAEKYVKACEEHFAPGSDRTVLPADLRGQGPELLHL